jgi:FAD/FMN-containing dehydrogenase
MTVTSTLADLVGASNVSDVPEVITGYAADYSLELPRRPQCVVYADSTDAVSRVMRYANETGTAVTARSSGVGFHGAGIPAQGGIILDLSRMKRVLEVSPRDKFVKVEPGVTWAELQPVLADRGLMVCNPLLPHPAKSVLTSVMEREPMLIPKSEYADNLLTSELVLPSGEMLWTGTAIGHGMDGQAFPESPIPTSSRLFQGAQGTLGVLTWAGLKLEWLPSLDRLCIIPLDAIEDAVRPIYRIQRLMLGNECLVLNRHDLAAILAQAWPDDSDALSRALPPYAILLVLSGLARHPEGRIDYEYEALQGIAGELGLDLLDAIPGSGSTAPEIVKLLRCPWTGDTYWKHRPRGGRAEVFFNTTLNRVPEFEAAVRETAGALGYPAAEIGIYLQPLERARACFLEFGFDHASDDADSARKLLRAVQDRVLDLGGLFTTPYGEFAESVFSRAAGHTSLMKQVKAAFDPNDVMNPGKLCF